MRTVEPERWRRIEELLDGVLDLPAGERAAWLARECGDDLALREAVERLAVACDCRLRGRADDVGRPRSHSGHPGRAGAVVTRGA